MGLEEMEFQGVEVPEVRAVVFPELAVTIK